MKYTTLKSTGLSVSSITFGCWELGGGQWEKESDDTNLKAIEQALELGINSFDTAEGYGNGHSEEIVGYALEGKRKDLVLATKVSPNHLKRDDIRRSVEASLKRLRTDYLDIYYVHWPNQEISLEETMIEFRRLKEEKVIRSIAVSNFSRAQLEEAEKTAKIDVIQPEYSLLHRSIEHEVVPYCIEHDIDIMTYSSIAKGILTGVYHLGQATLKDTDFRQNRRLFTPEHMKQETELVQLVRDIAAEQSVSMSEVAIYWLLRQPGVTSTIVGTQNIKHLEENVRVVELSLTEEDMAQLDKVSRKVITAIDGSF